MADSEFEQSQRELLDGLSGLGDLLTTCISPYSRNRMVGEQIAAGRKIDDIIRKMDMVAEGVDTTRSVYEFARNKKIDAPITGQVYEVMFKGKGALKAVTDLMTRSRKPE